MKIDMRDSGHEVQDTESETQGPETNEQWEQWITYTMSIMMKHNIENERMGDYGWW